MLGVVLSPPGIITLVALYNLAVATGVNKPGGRGVHTRCYGMLHIVPIRLNTGIVEVGEIKLKAR